MESLKIKAKDTFFKATAVLNRQCNPSLFFFPGKIKMKAPKMPAAVISSKENKIRERFQLDFPFLCS